MGEATAGRIVLCCLAGLAAALVVVGIPSTARAAPAPSRWCGTDEASSDRLPDAVASYQVHVVYAIPSDGTDRFFERALPIARDLAAIDTWWRLQDPARAPRFDLNAFPGCDSVFGAVDITVARLSQTGAVYGSLDAGARRLILTELFGVLSDPGKKYVVYYDGPVTAYSGICGFSILGPTDRGGSSSIVPLNADQGGLHCGTLGNADYEAVTAAHELLHNLGAVPAEAPHVCQGGHVCDSGDIMAPFGESNSLFDYALDVGHDDYYAHSGPWWDVQDSGWLSHLDAPQFALAVTTTGSGKGSVASDLPGIDCPGMCSIDWDSGTEIGLTAQPDDERTRFAAWTGACSGEAECVVTMDSAKTVGAEFRLQVSVDVSISRKGGAGRVTTRNSAIDCPGLVCEAVVDAGSAVALTAIPDQRSRLLGWSVPSCGARYTCSFRVARDSSVVATFGPGSYRLTALVVGQGHVRSNPAGISCAKTCWAPFSYRKTVRLTAEPARGWQFAGWSGACRGTSQCSVTITKASFVRAAFRRR